MSDGARQGNDSTQRRRSSVHEPHPTPAVTVTLAASLAPPDDTMAQRRHSFTTQSTASATSKQQRRISLQHPTTKNTHLLNVAKSSAARRASFEVQRGKSGDIDKYAYTGDISIVDK